MSDRSVPDADELVAAYKTLLRDYLARRPSGARQRIAKVMGTHKSFVSQITNPSYRVPVPAQHVQTIIDVCHFSPEERAAFLSAYRRAHPGFAEPMGPAAVQVPSGFWVPLPDHVTAEQAREIERVVRRLTADLIGLATPVAPADQSTGSRPGSRLRG